MRAVPKFNFDPVHKPCPCPVCVTSREIRMRLDLESEYGQGVVLIPAPKKDLVQ
jgi:hypothetical protein